MKRRHAEIGAADSEQWSQSVNRHLIKICSNNPKRIINTSGYFANVASVQGSPSAKCMVVCSKYSDFCLKHSLVSLFE